MAFKFKFPLAPQIGLQYKRKMPIEDPFIRFAERRHQREDERLRLSRRLAELQAENDRDVIAVAQLKQLYPNGFPQSDEPSPQPQRPVPDAIEPPPPPPSTVVESQRRGSGLMAKDIILSILKDAGPDGIGAKQIRAKAFIRYKTHINPNTLTVSLVRFSKGDQPKARCEGRTWYYIGAGNDAVHRLGGQPHNGNGNEKSPEVPGLL